MKTLRSILIFSFLAFGLFLSDVSVFSASATTGYLRIIAEDAPFYSDSGGNELLFYLPYTYYVKALDKGTYFTHVEISPLSGAAIDGYVPTEKLFDDGLTVTSPYPNLEITTVNATAFYRTKNPSEVLQYVFPNRNLTYYGKYESETGNALFFVGYNNRLGYVKEEDVMPFTIDNHPNPLTFLPPDPEPVDSAPKEEVSTTENVNVYRIIIIASLAFAGIIALFIAFRKKPQPHAAVSYYDENDYE